MTTNSKSQILLGGEHNCKGTYGLAPHRRNRRERALKQISFVREKD